MESTIVYQHAMGLPLRWLEELNRFLPSPDLVIVLDAEPEEIIRRLRERKKSVEIFENVEFLINVRELYKRRAREKNYIIVDTTGRSVYEIAEQVSHLIKCRLSTQRSNPSTGYSTSLP